MNRLLLTLAATAVVTPLASVNAGVIFSDNFSGSTINGAASTVNASQTYYESASAKNGSGAESIAAGKLTFGVGAASGSAAAELQALFPSVTLSSVGDYVDMQIVFTSSGILSSGSSSSASLNVGLMNSGGTGPLENGVLANAGISGSTTYNRGGARMWQGYIGILQQDGTQSIATRSAQTAVTDGTGNDNNGNQDIVLNGAVTGSARNPKDSSPITGAVGSAVTLTDGGTYLIDYKLTLSAADQLTVENSLYSGSTVDAGNLISSQSANETSLLTTTVDGLGIGWRATDSTISSKMDISSIVISTPSAVPEPSTLALAGLGLFGLFGAYRRQRRQA